MFFELPVAGNIYYVQNKKVTQERNLHHYQSISRHIKIGRYPNRSLYINKYKKILNYLEKFRLSVIRIDKVIFVDF
jgi:hypothetical protein